MSPAFNAVATYLPEVDSFQIVMKPVPEHWQQNSAWRRCNFTLAHELGHIFCGHLEIPKNLKTAERRRKDDLEADEFAARLLMPERLILKSRFSSFEELSKEFLVSDQVCFKRMNNLKRLDLIRQPNREPDLHRYDLLSRRSVVRSLSVYSSYQMRCDKFWASKKAAIFNVSSRY